MKTNIIVSVLRVKGYWHLLVKYTENGQPIRYQMSTAISTDQPLQKAELARRRMLSELYELNRMDAVERKMGSFARHALSACIHLVKPLAVRTLRINCRANS